MYAESVHSEPESNSRIEQTKSQKTSLQKYKNNIGDEDVIDIFVSYIIKKKKKFQQLNFYIASDQRRLISSIRTSRRT